MKKSDSKRQAILDTALRLFRTQGFDKTSVSEITAAVGGGPLLLAAGAPYDDPNSPAPEERDRRFPVSGAAATSFRRSLGRTRRWRLWLWPEL